MRAISDDEQRSNRAKSWLPKRLRRRRARTLLQLLPDVPHRRRRCASSSLRRRSQRGPRDYNHGLLGARPCGALAFSTTLVAATGFYQERNYRESIMWSAPKRSKRRPESVETRTRLIIFGSHRPKRVALERRHSQADVKNLVF